ncbi:MAG: beta-phosphoglucomutase [Saprospiraceae bacterium]|nr:beta-phosphoglucomutase [Saprospiraceae bacterium]
MKKIDACIFDLDGVICDTAKYHFKAWKRLANELGFDFTEEENEQLKGVSRVESLNLILHWGGKRINDAEEKAALATQKNDWYLELIQHMSASDILPGVEHFLRDVQKRGIKIALGSASKNSRMILDRLGLTHYFEVIIDGNSTSQSKPHPEVFLMGAEQLGVSPKNSIVFEDAEKGLEAARRGGFYAVGVGKNLPLELAHIVIPNFEHIDLKDIEDALSATATKK